VKRGYYWSARGLHAKSIADYEEAIRLDPNEPSTYYYRGAEWFRDLEPDKAIEDFTRAIQLDPKYAPAYRLRAIAWNSKHEYEKAVKDYSDVVRIRPDEFEGHNDLARILATSHSATIRHGKRVVAEATRACELTKWKDSACLDTLAATYAETGDFPAAVKWQTEAIKLHPEQIRMEMEEGLGFKGRLDFYRRGQPTRE
jgi:tetratricopeptide (TPR) repeat protein